MDTASIVAIISSVLSFIGVCLTVWVSNSKTQYRIEQLEKKVEKHNTVIDRTYHLEERAAIAEEKIKVANNRIDDLEHLANKPSKA